MSPVQAVGPDRVPGYELQALDWIPVVQGRVLPFLDGCVESDNFPTSAVIHWHSHFDDPLLKMLSHGIQTLQILFVDNEFLSGGNE